MHAGGYTHSRRQREQLRFSARAFLTVAVCELVLAAWSWSAQHDAGISLVIGLSAVLFAIEARKDAREARR